MRSQINARIADERGKNPVQPAAPIKQSQTNPSDRVVGHVTGRKRRIATLLVRRVRSAHDRLLEDRHELGARFLQPHHPDRIDVFRPFAINRRLQRVRDRLSDDNCDQQTTNARPRLEPAKHQRGKKNDDQQRLPDVGVADRRHEQIQRHVPSG